MLTEHSPQLRDNTFCLDFSELELMFEPKEDEDEKVPDYILSMSLPPL